MATRPLHMALTLLLTAATHAAHEEAAHEEPAAHGGGGHGHGHGEVDWPLGFVALLCVLAVIVILLTAFEKGVAASKATPNAARAANMGARSMGRPRAKSRGRFFLFFEN